MKNVKLLELFGGIGAPRKALENLGWNYESVDYVEIAPNSVKGYNAIYNENYVPQNILEWNRNVDVDILVHGSPCQDFSCAGKNDLSMGRSILYNRTLEIIRDVLPTRPKVVIWENVTNLLSNGNKVSHRIHHEHYLNAMREMGYTNYYKVLNASDYGIPQNRRRVFTVSIYGNDTFDFPTPFKRKTHIKDYLDNSSKAIELTDNEKHVFFRKNGNLYAREATKLGYKKVEEYDTINVEYPNSTTKRGRVARSSVNTLTCSPRRAVYVDNKVRLLNAKEQLMLMGFDAKDYDHMKAVGMSNFQISHVAGNSICVPVLEAIFASMWNIFNEQCA